MANDKLARIGAAVLAAGLLLANAGHAQAATLFVSATAASGGNGSEKSPFNALSAVERASAPGDEIIVLASPISAPPLDGGIQLKPYQKLIGRGPSVTDVAAAPAQAARITNTGAASNSGDAVVLAEGAEVSNLMILGSSRGGIYGLDAGNIDIHDNNISGTNTSCTPGFIVMFPGQIPLLPNGWAAIMADQDRGSAEISIHDNYIHDGNCNDGIDIRSSGTATVMARVRSNNVTRLAQGPKMRSLLAIGMQTRDQGVLSVDSDHDSMSNIGSPQADCEGLFANLAGGVLTWNIDHTSFTHGIGGVSCNGGEFFLSNGPATMNIYLSHSTFEDNPGDMIEEVNEGNASTTNVILKDVTVRHTTHPTAWPPEQKFSPGFAGDVNQGRCVAQSSHGHHNVSNLRVLDSHFSDCVGDGIGSVMNGDVSLPAAAAQQIGAAPMKFGDGEGDSMSVDVENTVIDGTPQYALHFMNQVPTNNLSVRVKDSAFSGTRGGATVAFDQSSTTRSASIDLDGQGSNASGGNCLLAGAGPVVETTGFQVSAKYNWWGRSGGPLPAQISSTGGAIDATAPLRAAPPACQRK